MPAGPGQHSRCWVTHRDINVIWMFPQGFNHRRHFAASGRVKYRHNLLFVPSNPLYLKLDSIGDHQVVAASSSNENEEFMGLIFRALMLYFCYAEY